MDELDPATGRPFPGPDPDAEPEGFLVVLGAGDRVHFLDWGGPGGRSPGAASDRTEPGPAEPGGTEPGPAEPDGTAPGPVESGGPGVMLVHGLAGTAWIWAPVARRLRTRRRTVAIDLPGHGLSDAPTDPAAYGPAALVEALVAAAQGARLLPFGPAETEAPDPERRLVVAGHGFGGSVAALAAARLGRRCSALVLVDGGWERLAETTGLDVEEYRRTTEEPPEVMRSMAAYLADRRAFDPATWDADQEHAARASVVELPVGRVVTAVRPHALSATVDTAFGYDPLAVLPAVEAPIVALVAADDAERTRNRALERTQAGLAAAGRPPISVARFDDAAHNLMRYRPADVTAAILAAAGGSA